MNTKERRILTIVRALLYSFSENDRALGRAILNDWIEKGDVNL